MGGCTSASSVLEDEQPEFVKLPSDISIYRRGKGMVHGKRRLIGDLKCRDRMLIELERAVEMKQMDPDAQQEIQVLNEYRFPPVICRKDVICISHG
jgi:hypothetical protein